MWGHLTILWSSANNAQQVAVLAGCFAIDLSEHWSYPVGPLLDELTGIAVMVQL